MAIIYLPYLFDEVECKAFVLPIIQARDYSLLETSAKQVVADKPQLNSLLDDIFLGYPFVDDDETFDHKTLLTVLMASFLTPLPTTTDWVLLKAALPLVGWTEAEVKLLLRGQSLSTFLSIDDPEWCSTYYYGWIDRPTVDQLHHKLKNSESAFMALTNHTDLWATCPIELAKRQEYLARAHHKLAQILEAAQHAERALAVTIA